MIKDKVFGRVTEIIEACGGLMRAIQDVPCGAKAEKAEEAEKVEEVEAAAPTAAMEAEVAAPAPAMEAEVAAPEPEPEQPAPVVYEIADEEPAPEITDADILAAVARARVRIEGEDYETNKQSERRLKFHKAITTWLKNFTKEHFGVEKPTLVPQEHRKQLINEIELLTEVDGHLGQETEPPF